MLSAKFAGCLSVRLGKASDDNHNLAVSKAANALQPTLQACAEESPNVRSSPSHFHTAHTCAHACVCADISSGCSSTLDLQLGQIPTVLGEQIPAREGSIPFPCIQAPGVYHTARHAGLASCQS